MIVFLLVAVSIWAGAHFYVRARLVMPADMHPDLKIWCSALLVLSMFMAPMAFWVHDQGGREGWKTLLEWAGYTTMGLSALLFGVTVIRDLIWLGALGGDWLVHLMTGRELFPSGPVRHSIFNWTSVGVVAVTAVLAVTGIRSARIGPRVETVPVVIPDLPPALDGFRLVLIADLHMNRTTPRGFARRLAGRVNALDPDLVAFVGDFGDGKVSLHQEEALALNAIGARHGKYFVTGNHEYYSDFPRWISVAKQAGFRVLMNENAIVEAGGTRFVIAGVTDHGAGRMGSIGGHETDFARAASGMPPGSFGVLLCHQPRDLGLAARLGFNLMLCGHTHGGQFFPYTYVVRLFFRHSRGLHDVDGMKLYVSRGTNYWGPPMRIGSPAEISLLILRSAP